MSEQWIDTAPTLDALEAQLGGESWSSRIQRDPLFAAQLAVVDCSDEVVKRTEHYEARIAELERREAQWDAFAAAFDWYRQWVEVCDTEGCASPEGLAPLWADVAAKRDALDFKPVVWIEPTDDNAEVEVCQ